MPILLTAVLATGCGGKPSLDAPGKAACEKVKEAGASQDTINTVVIEIAAIDRAGKSSVKGLHKAAITDSPATHLPTDDPGYQNPGDVQFAAVKAWCNNNA
ncbi:hypothetical protein M6D93_04090 [Jatrophihabitans telluris]|uniref:DUF732 domain-containing protein n=1 Tax=Jatrophihabitans telluris TaxID=2038343 RepID=A0ABY4R0B3_9ACTN|nr:hypothetical protein [Jatrophihabitans telluris]UQX89189.1 hypothetical protein M6D93_04090 [Jatrophihabitans telluris]